MTRLMVLLASIALVTAACADSSDSDSVSSDISGQTIVLLTHESFALSEETLDAFTAQSGVSVEVLQGGDAVETVNRAILTKSNPEADVLFGVDNNVLSRALDENLFVPYRAKGLDNVSDTLRIDDGDSVTPIDFGDVCINYDVAWFAENDLSVPISLDDLVDPAYSGLLVVQDPSKSTPGLAFLLASIDYFGEGGWQAFWTDLRANDVEVTSGWNDAYYGSFTVGGGGQRPLVVSYASSPAAEVFFAETPPESAPTGVMVSSCYRQIEFAGILAGTDNEGAARAFIDFMLTSTYQEDLPLNQFVFPAVEGTKLPEVFVENAQIADDPFQLDPSIVEQNRDAWVKEWTDLVLR